MRLKTLFLTFGVATVLLADPAKLSPDLKKIKGTVKVIVQYKRQPNAIDLVRILAKGILQLVQLPLLRGAAATIPAGLLDRLSDDELVEYITPDRTVRGALDYTSRAAGADLAATYGWNGSGITVAVLDSGIADSPDLHDAWGRSRVVYRESFVGKAKDDYGHGTHVAGIVAGNGAISGRTSAGNALRGIAPNARLVDLKVLDERGVGSDSAVIMALNRAIALKNVYNIRVVNLSLGRPVYESYRRDPLCRAVEAAWKAGLTVVVSAGNYGRDGFAGSGGYWTITAPANDPYVITVGAMKTVGTLSRGDDLIASYSSKGPTLFDSVVKPDLVAPGNQVASLLAGRTATLAVQNTANLVPPSYYGGNGGSYVYMKLSGTSMAAPVVSGAAALLLQRIRG
jgi:serine protease AprX